MVRRFQAGMEDVYQREVEALPFQGAGEERIKGCLPGVIEVKRAVCRGGRVLNLWVANPKSEFRNPKQI
jgi:hypothetical protein